jgi:peptide deformylase
LENYAECIKIGIKNKNNSQPITTRQAAPENLLNNDQQRVSFSSDSNFEMIINYNRNFKTSLHRHTLSKIPNNFNTKITIMIIKNIIQIGNPLLSQKSKLVKQMESREAQNVVKNLIDSTRYHKLIGMAASQIGKKLRIFITEVRKTLYRNPKDIDKLRVYINPKIVWYSKNEATEYEGCGSVAHAKLFAPVKRPEKIIIEAFDEKNNKFRFKTGGLLSRVIQHEYDHLDGKEFTEKITDIKKMMSSEEYIKKIASRNK